MFTNAALDRPRWLSFFGCALCLGWALAAIRSTGLVPLKPDEMSWSRGANQNLVLAQISCNSYSLLTPCTSPNQTCYRCERTTWTGVTGGSHGGYEPGIGIGTCGMMLEGTCNSSLNCVDVHATEADCIYPPSSPTIQTPS